VRQVLTDLDELEILDRLKRNLYDDWQNSDAEAWPMIQAKLDVLESIRTELRQMANQGVDDAG
jgi:hypothetical protein